MRKRLPKILVTGGAGFIGSAFVKTAIKHGFAVAVVDKLTYAGDSKRLKGVKIKFYKADICDKEKIKQIFDREKPEIVVNFAAESHVDRSIEEASAFLKTNICGTQVLLDASMASKVKRFIHMSTDEVYGDIESGEFFETTPLNPSSPYSASKGAADLLIKSYARTYSFPAIIVRPSNNYGPWQYPEKFIPLAILKILRGQNIPVYGKGLNVREWLFVQDCVEGIIKIIKRGKIGHVYNLGSGHEYKNIDVAKLLLKILKAKKDRIEFVKDRLGHDFRYRLNSDKVKKDAGWKAKTKLLEGLELTVDWYLENYEWVNSKWDEVSRLYSKRRS